MFDQNAVSGTVASLTHHFNTLAIVGGGVAVAGLVALKKAGPKIISPDSTKAYIVTGYKFPFPKKDQFVIRNAPQTIYQMGASKPEEVSLQSFTVNVARKGIHRPHSLVGRAEEEFTNEKDESLTLKDNIKVEVDVDFYVQVDTEDTHDKDGKVISTGDQNIIKAKRTLGEVNEKSIEKYLLSKADSALRAAAAQMTIEEIQGDREAFIDAVKKNISLSDHGLKVTDAALKDFRQAPLASFDKNNYFDAQGLEKVTKVANASLKAVNDSNQTTQTIIAQTTQEQTIARLEITRAQTQAELGQKQEIAKMTAERERQIAEIQAQEKQKGDIAQIIADQQTQEREIEKQRQIGVANAQKDQATQVAQEQSAQAAAAARIGKEKTVELANRDKEIALQQKAAEVAEAQQAANTKRSEAVAAEQGVITAAEVAKAEREKQVAVIEAEREAEREAASRKIQAAADVIVAEAQANAARETAKGKADAAVTEAAASAEAATKRAAGSYAETYQPLKAKADGDLAQAAAEKALNDARNALSDEARRQQVELKRVEITPEVAQILVAAIASIDNFNVTSISGAPSLAGGIAGNEGGIAANQNVFEQFYDAARRNSLAVPLMKRMITDMGGDPSIVDNLPGGHTTPPLPAVSLPPPAENNNTPPAPAAAVA